MMDFRYEYEGKEYTIQLESHADGTYTAIIGNRTYPIQVQRVQAGQFNLIINGRRIHAYTASQKSSNSGIVHHYVALVDREVKQFELITPKITSDKRRGASGEPSSLKAQMPGQVMQILVKTGDKVTRGQTLLILEAMKMEIRVTAPYDGTIDRLIVNQGDTVDRDQQLIDLTPHD